jgi:hypothetical protein
MVEHKQNNRAILIQTIILVVTLLSIAIAADRRVTVVEDNLRSEVEVRKTINKQHDAVLEKLQSNEQKVIENQARVAALLEVVVQRHSLEDQRKSR